MEIGVFARVRAGGAGAPLRVDHNIVAAGTDRGVPFEAVLPEHATTEALHARIGHSLLTAFVDGSNAALLLLGESDTGKTHVLAGTGARGGLVPCLISELFGALEARHAAFELGCEFSEVYNELITDLVNPGNRASRIVETADRGTVIDGLTSRKVGKKKKKEK